MTKSFSEIWPFRDTCWGGALNPKEVCTDEVHCLNVMRGVVFPKFSRFGANGLLSLEEGRH